VNVRAAASSARKLSGVKCSDIACRPIAAAAKSIEVLNQLGPDIQWVESYVAADKTFCIYLAKDEAIIRKHAEISGFPASKITEVRKMIDPTTERPD
jgi:hypothetical protein